MTESYDERFAPLIDHVRLSNSLQYASAAGLVVIQSGNVLVNWRDGVGVGPDGNLPINSAARFNVYSVRKAFIGLAAAITLHRQTEFSVDTHVRDYVLDVMKDSEFRNVSPQLQIRHLLTHTHGLAEQHGNIIQSFDPGARWMYNNIGVELLCRIVHSISGKSVAEIMRYDVFQPAGLTRSGWEADASDDLVRDVIDPAARPELQLGPANGHDRNLYVTPEDLARFAQLHLNEGQIDGKQMIPSEVIRTMRTCQTPPDLNPNMPRHGFFWWLRIPYAKSTEIGPKVPERSYQIAGMNGSLCLVMPDLDAVVVRTMNKIGPPSSFDRFGEFHRLGNLAADLLN